MLFAVFCFATQLGDPVLLFFSIHNTIDYLKSRKYTCFWAGAQGELSPFLDGCNYDFKRWSNVVCSHDPQVLRVFHLLVPESFRHVAHIASA